MDNTIVTYIITNGCDGVYFFFAFLHDNMGLLHKI